MTELGYDDKYEALTHYWSVKAERDRYKAALEELRSDYRATESYDDLPDMIETAVGCLK